MDLSITIITLNEGKNIRVCLESVKSLGAEIILVDSGSTDDTVQIAKKYNAKIYTRSFDNFSDQKNYAVSKATKKWILSLDPDEQLNTALSNEIRDAIKLERYDAFLIGRRNFILGSEIKYSRWSPDEHIWLWKKDMGEWKGFVHEEILLKGRVGKLINKKIHYQSDNISDFLQSNNFYSDFEARERFKRGERFSIFRMFIEAIYEFLIRYIYKLGFLDGKVGFILAYLMGIYKIIVSVKIYQLQFIKKCY